MVRTVFTITGIILLMGCQHSVTIRSSPVGAEVYAIKEGGTRSASLGKTPITLPVQSGEILGLEINSPGYNSSYIFVPPPQAGKKVELHFTLLPQSRSWFQAMLLDGQSALLNESLYELLELQALIAAGKRVETQTAIDKLEKKYSRVAAFHTLVGHHNYLRKNMPAAKAAYQRALSLDPNNEEAKNMLDLFASQERR